MSAESKTKVLLVDTNDAMGGVVRVHLNLLRTINQARFDVAVACLGRGEVFDRFDRIPGIRVYPLETGTKATAECGGPAGKLRNLASSVTLLKAAFKLARYCRMQHLDVIHTSDKKRALVLVALVHLLTRIPFIYHIHNVYVDYRLNRLALRRAHAIVANSGDMKRDFIEALGAPMERIGIVYNGLDPEEYAPGPPLPIRTDLGLADDTVLFGIVSRLAPDKGQDTYLEAAAMVAHENPNVHFTLVGDDKIFSDNADYVPRLKSMSESLGIKDRVTFLGYRHDMPDVYRTLDVVVDAAWREAFGMVVIEPMACGKVVIGTDAGGIPEIIDDGVNGLLFAPRNAKALAAAMHRIADDAALRETLGRNARSTVLATFTIEAQTRDMERVYAQTAGAVT